MALLTLRHLLVVVDITQIRTRMRAGSSQGPAAPDEATSPGPAGIKLPGSLPGCDGTHRDV